MVKYHHENYDGSGYLGLVGEEIPTGARILKIVDVFDVLVSDRVYHKGVIMGEAIEIMRKESKAFDPILLDSFFDGLKQKIKVGEI